MNKDEFLKNFEDVLQTEEVLSFVNDYANKYKKRTESCMRFMVFQEKHCVPFR